MHPNLHENTFVPSPLQVLDLESNSVRDAEQAIQLGTCPRLWSLTLTANPVCCDRHYRRTIVEAVPQLASLDEEDVKGNDGVVVLVVLLLVLVKMLLKHL